MNVEDALPYHLHLHAACDYNACDWSGHSTAVALALDGRIMYGLWEDYGVMPSLDQCNGHYGNTPECSVTDGNGTTLDIPAMTNIYHYHFSGTEEPFTLGCYGPVDDIEHCESLYDTCEGDTVDITVMLNDGTVEDVTYDPWCPCFPDDEDKYNDNPQWIYYHCDGNLPPGMEFEPFPTPKPTATPCENDETWTNNRGLNCNDIYDNLSAAGRMCDTAAVSNNCCATCAALEALFQTTEETTTAVETTTSPVETEAPTEQSFGTNTIIYIMDDFSWHVDFDEAPASVNDTEKLSFDLASLTPSLWNLRLSSTVYTNAYTTSSSCAPSRFGLLTGRHTSQSPYSNIDMSNGDLSEWNNRAQIGGVVLMVEDFLEKNLAHELQKQGYYTCFVGKWHLWDSIRLYNSTYDDTTYQQTQESVLRMGFDYADALYHANIPEFEDADFSHNNEWIAYKAQECISNAVAAEKPYFLWVAPTSPHSPPTRDALCGYDISLIPNKEETFDPPVEFHTFRDTICDRDSGYTGRAFDAQLGYMWTDFVMELLNSHLEENNLVETTETFFTFDHGTAKTETSVDGAKISFWYQTAGQTEGATDSRLMSHIDVAATLYDRLLIATDYELYGRSLLQPEDEDQSVWFVWNSDRAVLKRGDDGYYVLYDFGRSCELYDLDQDPYQTTDILLSSSDANPNDILSDDLEWLIIDKVYPELEVFSSCVAECIDNPDYVHSNGGYACPEAVDFVASRNDGVCPETGPVANNCCASCAALEATPEPEVETTVLVFFDKKIATI